MYIINKLYIYIYIYIRENGKKVIIVELSLFQNAKHHCYLFKCKLTTRSLRTSRFRTRARILYSYEDINLRRLYLWRQHYLRDYKDLKNKNLKIES